MFCLLFGSLQQYSYYCKYIRGIRFLALKFSFIWISYEQVKKTRIERGSVTRFFFHQIIPPRTLIQGQQPLCICFKFAEFFEIMVCKFWFHSLNEIAGLDSAISMRLQDWIPQSHWDCRIRFCGLIEKWKFL
jgi:hypothetical protein